MALTILLMLDTFLQLEKALLEDSLIAKGVLVAQEKKRAAIM